MTDKTVGTLRDLVLKRTKFSVNSSAHKSQKTAKSEGDITVGTLGDLRTTFVSASRNTNTSLSNDNLDEELYRVAHDGEDEDFASLDDTDAADDVLPESEDEAAAEDDEDDSIDTDGENLEQVRNADPEEAADIINGNYKETPKKGKKKRIYDQNDEDAPPPKVTSLTELAAVMKDNNYKVSIFNVKAALIRYMDAVGDRRAAAAVMAKPAEHFVEIHAVYIPGAEMYQVLKYLGFVALHPTDLEDDPEYNPNKRYEVSMSNGYCHVNLFGGLQEHAPCEETVIRSLKPWELKQYRLTDDAAQGETRSAAADFDVVEDRKFSLAKNQLLAAMAAKVEGRADVSYSMFNQFMESEKMSEVMASVGMIRPPLVELTDSDAIAQYLQGESHAQ